MEFNSENYFKYPALNASGINQFINSPAVFWRHTPLNPNYEATDQTEGMLLGSLAHMLVLEDETVFKRRYYVAPKGLRMDKRTADYKAVAYEAAGREIVRYETFEKAQKMSVALLKHPVARKLLYKTGREEPILSESGDIPRKAKMDAWQEGLIIDYKTTSCLNQHEYERASAKYGYHRAAAHYIDVYADKHGEKPKGFVHIVQVSGYEESIGVFVMPDDGSPESEIVTQGRSENARATDLIKARLEANNWETFERKVVNLKLPDYYRTPESLLL